jgi:hypothetical protein
MISDCTVPGAGSSPPTLGMLSAICRSSETAIGYRSSAIGLRIWPTTDGREPIADLVCQAGGEKAREGIVKPLA